MWLDWLFPPICQGCGSIGQWVCDHCLEQIEFYPNPVVTTLTESAFDQILAATYFQPPMSKVIKALKYRGVKDVGTWLGSWLYEVAPIPIVDYVTAIPLHASKKTLRGYNQAELIAKSLAQQLQVQYLPLLVKTQATQAQATITDKTQRLHQLDGIFSLEPAFSLPIYIEKLKSSHVLLVDDVVTTGATLNAAAGVLKEIGVGKVTGLAVAHGQ
jgi:competence protein ComFC